MIRCYRSLLLTLLAGAIILVADPAWAQTKVQTQNPPQKKAADQKAEQTDQEYTEEEYNAWEAADKETDPVKKAAQVMAFLQKYPKSTLKPNMINIYETLLHSLYKAGDYKNLEPLAEQWLKINPNEIKIQAYVFDAAVALAHHQKIVDFGEKLYAVSPGVKLAEQIYQAYEKLGNKEKKDEWRLKLLQFPEYANNIHFLFQLVVEHIEKKELSKAANWAQQALKALPGAQKPASASEAEWDKFIINVKQTCYDTIGSNYYTQRSYKEAMQNYEKAVDIEDYDVGYFYIGQCQVNFKDVDGAIDSFARAEHLDGKLKSQATKWLLELYMPQHDGTQTGIQKVRNRAKSYIEERKKIKK